MLTDYDKQALTFLSDNSLRMRITHKGDTMKTALEQMKERHAKELALAEKESSIISALPDDLPKAPTISNIRPDGQIYAWLNFSSPAYDPEKTWNPVAILASLERAGWVLIPATLCKWDNYRHSTEPGAIDIIPEERKGSFGHLDKLTDASPIAPLWIIPEHHTGSDAQCYMRAPDGHTFKVLVDAPGLASLSARRVEMQGGWYFERGTARLLFPERWHSHQLCTVHEQSRAFVDTEQGISGAIYFAPHDEQTEWNEKASDFLASLIAESK